MLTQNRFLEQHCVTSVDLGKKILAYLAFDVALAWDLA